MPQQPTMAFHLIIIVFTAFPCMVESVNNPTITFNIEEELPNGYKVGSIASESREFHTSNDTNLQYNFIGTSNSQTMFSIHDKSGDVFTLVKMDRESVCQYDIVCKFEFDVSVMSDNSLLFIVSVNVIIEDKNDNSPLFPVDTETVFISEGSSVSDTFDIEPAVDRDYGGNNSIQTYELLLEETDKGLFSLNWKKNIDMTFDVKFVLNKKLDREITDTYTAQVIAKDGGTPVNSGTLNLIIKVTDINDNAPEFSHDIYNVTVKETIAPLMTILNISAIDEDIGDNAKISYRISEHQKDRDVLDKMFFVSEMSGEVKVKAELSAFGGQSFEFIVVAADNGSKPLSSQARVIVHIEDSGNNPPTVTITTIPNANIQYINVTENAVLKTFVAHVNVDDPDQGPNGNVSCEVSNKHFAIEKLGSKGFVVTVNSSLDREVKVVHNLTVTCTDQGDPILSGSASFLVRVTDKNDNKPVFEKSMYTAKLNENNHGNEILLQVAATDADEGNNALFQYGPHEDVAGRFIIDPNTGVITMNTILDREADSIIEFRVLAIDNGTPSLTGTTTISVTVEDTNDHRPMFTKSVNPFSIKENMPSGTDVTILTAEDMDLGLNAEFDFTIAPEYVDQVPFILFADGLLKANKQLDREERSRYDFVAIVRDHGEPPLSSSAHFTIFVEDVNDNSPIVTFPKPSNNSVIRWYPDYDDEYVAMIEAYDLDEGLNKDLEFSILGGNDLDIFAIDPSTGYLYFENKVDIGADNLVTLDISVKDKGEPPLETVKRLFVQLKYTNATFIGSASEDNSKYIIISVVVVVVTMVISGIIIGAILFMRTLDKRRKQQKETEITPDSDFGFSTISPQNHTILTVDSLSAGSGEGHDIKKKEVSFILDSSNSLEYHQKQSIPSNASIQSDRPSIIKVPEPYSQLPPRPVTDRAPGSLDAQELHNEANVQLHSMKMQQYILQNRAKQWVQAQQQFGTLPHEDHHSEGSSETVGSDSGRGYSEEDDLFSTPSGDDPKLFEVSSPESQHNRVLPRQPDRYTDIQRSSSCIKKPLTYKPNIPQRDFRTSQNLNIRNIKPNIAPISRGILSDNYSDLGSRNRVSWGSSAMYGHIQPMDFTGDSALHSFFDKTPMAYLRDDDDNYSTTTSGSYTINSEEIL